MVLIKEGSQEKEEETMNTIKTTYRSNEGEKGKRYRGGKITIATNIFLL